MNKTAILAALAVAPVIHAAEFQFKDGSQLLQAHLLGNVDDSIDGVAGYPAGAYSSQTLINQGDLTANFGRLEFDQTLTSTINTQSIAATAGSDVTFTELEGSRGGGASFNLTSFFSVDATTSFSASANFSIDGIAGTTGILFELLEVGAGDVFNFSASPSAVGGTQSFSYDGILRKDRTYRLQWSFGSLENHVTTADLDFRITATPIPEPSTYAALAGVGLLAFGVWRRASNRATLTP